MPMGGQQHAEQKNKTKKGQTNTLFGAMRWRESSSCSFGIVSSMKSLLNITQPALGDVESWKIERKRRRLSLSLRFYFLSLSSHHSRPSSESGLSPKRRVLSFNDAPMLSPLGSIQFPRQSSRKEHKRVSLIMIPRASQHHCCRSLKLFFFEHKKNHYIYRRL